MSDFFKFLSFVFGIVAFILQFFGGGPSAGGPGNPNPPNMS